MDATPEEAAEGMALVRVLAAVLERLVSANAPLARADPGQITKFHALKAPGIGVLQYLERIHKYASCSNECFILALIYIDRLIQRNNFLLTELNVHRVVITAIQLAAKFFDDAYYNNAYYAKVGGVLVTEMNGLEVDFLFRINFSLHVTPELFEKYHAELVSHSVGTGATPQAELRQSPSTASSCRTSPHLEGTTVLVPPVGVMARQAESQNQRVVHTDPQIFSKGFPMQITPSPRPHSAQPDAPPPHVAPGCSGDLVSVQSSNSMFAATQQYGVAFPPASSEPAIDVSMSHQFSMSMQRHNSMPAPTKGGIGGALLASAGPVAMPTFPVAQQRCSPHSAYSVPGMVPVVSDSSPSGVSSNGMESTEQYVVVDSTAYPLQGGLIHHHHGANVDMSGVYHQHGRSNGSAQPAHGQITQQFVGGQMLTGCTGGL